MKPAPSRIRNFLKDPYLLCFFLLYILALFSMWAVERFPLGDQLVSLVILGILFPAAALLVTRGSTPIDAVRPAARLETITLPALFVYLTLVLTFVTGWVNLLLPGNWLADERARQLTVLVRKLLFFVAIPFSVYRIAYGFNLRDFGFTFRPRETFTRKNLLIVGVMGLLLLLLQIFLSNGGAPFRNRSFTGSQLMIGLPVCFLWLLLEVGLVEEFFFRAVLQSRLKALLKSDVGSILVGCLAFGLCHAPGFYLRGGGVMEQLGQHPSLLVSVGYSITVISLGGLFLAIVWNRTRNIWPVMVIHALGDLIPSMQQFVTTWHIK